MRIYWYEHAVLYDSNFVRHAVIKLRDAVSNNQMQLLLGKAAAEGKLNLENIELLPGVYSNNIRLSEVFTCITENPALTLEKLFADFVGLEAPTVVSNHITRTRILKDVRSSFRQQGLFDAGLKEDFELPVRAKPVVDLAYQNHVLHCYQVIPPYGYGNENHLLQAVNAIRTVKRDVKDAKNASPEVQGAKFAVLTVPLKNVNARVADIKALLEDEGFEILDYRDTDSIGQSIARDLRANQPMVIN